jgi:hypothetical protein
MYGREAVQAAIDRHNGILKDAAAALEIPPPSMYRLAKKWNLSFNNQRRILDVDPTVLRDLYQKHQSLRKVATELGHSYDRIRAAMSHYNVPYNDPITYDWNKKFWDEDNETVFYWAGFIAADGCLTNKYSSQLAIGLAEKDRDHLERFKNDIQAQHPIKSTNHHSVQLSIHSTSLKKQLSRFGIVPRKTKILKFPNWLKKHELACHYLRGYFDGDGCWSISSPNAKVPQFSFSVIGTEHFLNGYRDVLCLNGIKHKQLYQCGNVKRLNYGGNCTVSRIRDVLYKDATLFLQRKLDVVKNVTYMYQTGSVKVTEDMLRGLIAEHGTRRKVAEVLGMTYGNLAYYVSKFNLFDAFVQ